MFLKITRSCLLGNQSFDAGDVVKIDDDRATKLIERGAAEATTDGKKAVDATREAQRKAACAAIGIDPDTGEYIDDEEPKASKSNKGKPKDSAGKPAAGQPDK